MRTLLFSRLLSLMLLPILGGVVTAANPVSPLSLVPAEADFCVQIPKPRLLIEAFAKNPRLLAGSELGTFQELLESTNVRRFIQLVRYYERDLGAEWPQLLDQLAGRGIIVAGKYTGGNTLGVIIGANDAEVLSKFIGMARKVAEDEYSRQESKLQITEETKDGITVLSLGGQAYLAQFGANLIITAKKMNVSDVQKFVSDKGVKLIASKKYLASKELIPASSLLTAWVHLDPTKEREEIKVLFAQPRNDAIQTFLFCGLLDIYKRSPSLVVSLTAENEQMKLSVRLPAGRDGLAPDTVLHLSHNPEAANTLPLLQPPGTVFSHSFYLDLAAMWNDRKKIFNEASAKGFDDADKNAVPGLPELSLSKILTAFGPHHRIVIATVPRTTYKTATPLTPLPDFGGVTSIPDASTRRLLTTAIRTGALTLSTQTKLRYTEEKIGKVKLIGYRFDEKGTLDVDTERVRFNFSPCFAEIGDQVMVASSLELGRLLVAELQDPAKKPSKLANMQMGFFGDGTAALLNRTPDSLMTQTILDRALTPHDAQREIALGLTWLKSLGSIKLKNEYAAKSFEFSLTWTPNSAPIPSTPSK